MDEIDRAIWQALEEKALAKIDAGQPSSLPRSTRVLQFQILPSFSNPRSWSVYRHESGYIATEITWHREAESPAPEALMFDTVAKLRFRYKGLENIEPTLTTLEATLGTTKIESLLGRLNRVHIPLVLSTNEDWAGLDGTTYELRVGDSSGTATFRWWENQPAHWWRLREWAQALLELLGDSYDK
jgi:hypothetical protein